MPKSDGIVVQGSMTQAGPVVFLAAGTAAAPSLASASSLGTGLFFPSADRADVAVAGVSTVRIDANGLGYPAGVGGAVTQITSKATAVTLSKVAGQITTHAASLAAAAIVSFVLTNTKIGLGDVLILNHVAGGTLGSYLLNARAAAGSATIDIFNPTAGALAEALVIQFVLVKGALA
jgi:hypothetical protein